MKRLTFKNGNLYLDSELYETYFNSINSVILLKQNEQFMIMPVQHASGGGLLLKIKNAKGDRVVHAAEFFNQHDIDCNIEKTLDAKWNTELAALTFSMT